MALLPLDGPPRFTPIWVMPILWQFFEEGVCLLELFESICTSLAMVLQASIWFTNTCMRTPTWWLQGKVVHFLHHNLIFSKMGFIYMLLTCLKNNNFPILWLDLEFQLE
jgi:hypothetical protein